MSCGSSPLLTPAYWFSEETGIARGAGKRRSNVHVHVHTRETCVLRNSRTCSPPSFRSRPSGRNLWGLRARRGRRTRRKRDFSGTGVRKHRGPTESYDPSSPRDFRLDPDSRSFETEWIGWRPVESIVLHSLRILPFGRCIRIASYTLDTSLTPCGSQKSQRSSRGHGGRMDKMPSTCGACQQKFLISYKSFVSFVKSFDVIQFPIS